MSGFRRSFRITDHDPDARRDVDDEIAFHLAMRERELVALGHTAEEAARLAREAFGDCAEIAAASVRETRVRTRRQRWLEAAASVRQDVRFALRSLARAPVFAAMAVATLGLGIGANAGIFGLFEAALLRAPAVRDPGSLAAVYTTCRRGDPRCASSYPDYEQYRDRAGSVADMAAYAPFSLTLWDGGSAELVRAELTTGNYFAVLGVSPVVGRTLVPADGEPGADHRVAVISESLWRNRFDGDPGVVGRRIRLNEQRYTVVGVAPRAFRGLWLGAAPDVWAPLRGAPVLFPSVFDGSRFGTADSRWIGGLVARLAPGATLDRVRSDLLRVSDQLAAEDANARGPRRVTVDPLATYVVPGQETVSSVLVVLQAAVGLTLLLACANLANLLIARGSSRTRELAVRVALGAGRRRLLRQLLTESAVLAALGAVAGAGFAWVLLRALAGVRVPFGVSIADLQAGVNARVLGFTILLALVAGCLAGLLPAFRATRRGALAALRQQRGGVVDGPAGVRVRGALVAVQLALCVVLLVGAGLFVRTLRDRLQVDIGFDPSGVALMTLDPSMNGYPPERTAALSRELVRSAGALPGVIGASAGTRVPVRPSGAGTFVDVAGYTPPEDEEMRVEYAYVGPGYFEALRLPIIRGRELSDADRVGSEPVIIINEAMAARWWPGRDALGGRVRFGGEDHRVVGIVRNTAYDGLDVGADPFVFAALEQYPGQVAESVLTLAVRTRGDASALLPGLRDLLRSTAPDLAVMDLTTMESELATTLAPQRGLALLLTLFAALALALAIVGIYGVVSYVVGSRRRELGVRAALGARPVDLVRHALAGLTIPVVAGVAAGCAGAVAASDLVGSMLSGVEPGDPATLATAVAVLVGSGMVAALIPARRAAASDPIATLRAE